MKAADGNVPKAIGMYNAGKTGSPEQARGYFLAVVDRFWDTFVRAESYSPTRYHMLWTAKPEYFVGVASDALYRHLSEIRPQEQPMSKADLPMGS
jgi:hypothetical protein